MRKRCKRKVWGTGGTPVLFAMNQTALNRSSLRLRSALDAVLDHTADVTHVAILAALAQYCAGMCVRMLKDGTAEPEQLRPAHEAALAAAEAVASVNRRLQSTGKVGCTGPEREALKDLLDVSDQIDQVGTRRQSRDVYIETLRIAMEEEATA